MNPIRRIAAVLAGLAAGLMAFGATPAFARVMPPPGTGYAPAAQVPAPVRKVTHTLVLGGMPGWQITLIAVGAALLAATVAVLAYRAWSTRREPATAAA